jgi:MoaA/NifB/PqqE/SkfB family radical SAM enzyme
MAGVTTPPLRAPLSVCLWIVDRCNLNCKYCYAAPFAGTIMDAARLEELVQELVDLEVFDLVFAGGEPFLHPSLFDIIERSVDCGRQVAVLTNGTALNAATRRRLARIAAGKRFLLQVSLDSADPTVNDATRGRGALIAEHVLEIARAGVAVQLACVVTRVNLDTAHEIIQAFYPTVKRFHFLNVQRTQRALEHPEILISEEEARRFWLRLRDYARGFPPDLFLPSLRVMLRAYGEEEERDSVSNADATFRCRSCSVGITHINVDANFNVLGCDIAKDFTVMGNVEQRSFREVWTSREAAKIRSLRYPPCYQIRGPDGHALVDFLKPEYA